MMKDVLVSIGIVLAIFTVVIALIGAAVVSTMNYENQQPCSYFKNTTVKNLPARCVEYFRASEVQ
jgi:hypothetical protein